MEWPLSSSNMLSATTLAEKSTRAQKRNTATSVGGTEGEAGAKALVFIKKHPQAASRADRSKAATQEKTPQGEPMRGWVQSSRSGDLLCFAYAIYTINGIPKDGT